MRIIQIFLQVNKSASKRARLLHVFIFRTTICPVKYILTQEIENADINFHLIGVLTHNLAEVSVHLDLATIQNVLT